MIRVVTDDPAQGAAGNPSTGQPGYGNNKWLVWFLSRTKQGAHQETRNLIADIPYSN